MRVSRRRTRARTGVDAERKRRVYVGGAAPAVAEGRLRYVSFAHPQSLLMKVDGTRGSPSTDGTVKGAKGGGGAGGHGLEHAQEGGG